MQFEPITKNVTPIPDRVYRATPYEATSPKGYKNLVKILLVEGLWCNFANFATLTGTNVPVTWSSYCESIGLVKC